MLNYRKSGDKKIIENISDNVNDYQETINEAKDNMLDFYQEGKDIVLEFIKDRPISSVLAAGGFGFLLAVLIRRNKG